MLSGIDEYLAKASSVTCYDVANRFNIRMSVARKILREKETKGELVPYIREGGFVVYTTPAEMDKRAGGVPIMISDVFEEIASTVTSQPVITDEMDEALLAAGTPGAVKPSKLARKRRERGERKERKDERPEVIVEPLPVRSEPEPEPEAPKKEEKPKKAAPKKTTKKEEKPKKAAPKKTTKKEEKPKKAKTPKLQDLPGVGPKMEETLQAAGIKTVKKLAGMDVDKLTNVDGVGKATAESLIKAAKDAI